MPPKEVPSASGGVKKKNVIFIENKKDIIAKYEAGAGVMSLQKNY